MGFSINSFRSELANNGTLKPTHFQTIFSSPKGLGSEYNDLSKILLRCDQVTLPGVSHASEDIRRFGYGPIERAPYLSVFDTISCSFIVDSQAQVNRFFYDWASLVVNFNSSASMRVPNKFDALPYEASYYDDFVVDFFILSYDQQTNTVMQYQLLEAYPVSVSQVDLSWGSLDEFVRLNVTFNYRDWAQKTQSVSNFNAVGGILGSLSNALGISSTNLSQLEALSGLL